MRRWRFACFLLPTTAFRAAVPVPHDCVFLTDVLCRLSLGRSTMNASQKRSRGQGRMTYGNSENTKVRPLLSPFSVWGIPSGLRPALKWLGLSLSVCVFLVPWLIFLFSTFPRALHPLLGNEADKYRARKEANQWLKDSLGAGPGATPEVRARYKQVCRLWLPVLFLSPSATSRLNALQCGCAFR